MRLRGKERRSPLPPVYPQGVVEPAVSSVMELDSVVEVVPRSDAVDQILAAIDHPSAPEDNHLRVTGFQAIKKPEESIRLEMVQERILTAIQEEVRRRVVEIEEDEELQIAVHVHSIPIADSASDWLKSVDFIL